jgi:hypothetical protein
MDHDCLEVMLFSLFHLGGHLMCPSPVLSLLGKGVLLGALIGVTYHSLPYLTLFILGPSTVYLSSGMVVTCTPKRHVPSSSYEKKG